MYQDNFLNFSLKNENMYCILSLKIFLFPFFLTNCASIFLMNRSRSLTRWKPSSFLNLSAPVEKYHSYHPCRWDRALLCPHHLPYVHCSVQGENQYWRKPGLKGWRPTFHVDICQSLGLVCATSYPVWLGPLRTTVLEIWGKTLPQHHRHLRPDSTFSNSEP